MRRRTSTTCWRRQNSSNERVAYVTSIRNRQHSEYAQENVATGGEEWEWPEESDDKQVVAFGVLAESERTSEHRKSTTEEEVALEDNEVFEGFCRARVPSLK